MGFFRRIVGGKTEVVTPDGQSASDQPVKEPVHITAAEFDGLVLTSQVPAVVDFWAEWCGPCHAISPSVAALAKEYDGRALITKMNADDYPEILMRYGIMGIPTLIYFQNGKEADRVVGVTSFQTLKARLDRLLP